MITAEFDNAAVAGIFTILPHTPVTAVGLNRNFHYKIPSKEAWHAIGNLLAPKKHWDPIMENPGLRAMIINGRRRGDAGGNLHVRIEPSSKLEHGIFVEINEEFRRASESRDTDWVPGCLVEHWESVMQYAVDTLEYFVGLKNDAL
jgi:hypothetical protein